MEKRIVRYGFIADLTKARKPCVCRHCSGVIRAGHEYYRISIGGGGLQSIKFPNRVHIDCVDAFLEQYREGWERAEALSKRLRMRRLCAWCRKDKDTGEHLTDAEYEAASKNATNGICEECLDKEIKKGVANYG